jgi:hypothetical protein
MVMLALRAAYPPAEAMDTLMAGAALLPTLAPLATVRGDAVVETTTPLVSLPVQVMAVLAWLGSGEHWA